MFNAKIQELDQSVDISNEKDELSESNLTLSGHEEVFLPTSIEEVDESISPIMIDEKTPDIKYKEKFTLPSGKSIYDMDFDCLEEGHWLSGAVISFYAKAIYTFREKDRKKKIYWIILGVR